MLEKQTRHHKFVSAINKTEGETNIYVIFMWEAILAW